MNLLKSKRKTLINSPLYLVAFTWSVPPLLAHTNHPHNTSNNTVSTEAHNPESAAMPEMVSEQEPSSSTVEIAPSPKPATTKDATLAITESSSFSNPLWGLGEIILALLVTGPFLLLAIKRQIQK
ncbi:MAG: hypothetical protein WA919_21080 [Coleofasciculaceae cyanobacterium]